MRPSRGMGAIDPSKMPGKRVIRRTDNPDDMYAKGGTVADKYTKSLEKAGFYEASKSKRLDIINKVTTKPQRIEMVDKLFLAKKAKGKSK